MAIALQLISALRDLVEAMVTAHVPVSIMLLPVSVNKGTLALPGPVVPVHMGHSQARQEGWVVGYGAGNVCFWFQSVICGQFQIPPSSHSPAHSPHRQQQVLAPHLQEGQRRPYLLFPGQHLGHVRRGSR